MIDAITRAFCRMENIRVREGHVFTDYRSLMPYIFMDAAYQVFDKSVRREQLTHEQRLWQKRTSDAFRQYFNRWKIHLSPEEYAWLLDLSDEFETYIAPHVTVASVQYMNVVTGCMDFETQKVSADYWIINCLAAHAQSWFRMLTHDRLDNSIATVLTCSKSMSKKFFMGDDVSVPVDDRDMERLGEAIGALFHVVERWAEGKTEELRAKLDEEKRMQEQLEALKAAQAAEKAKRRKVARINAKR